MKKLLLLLFISMATTESLAIQPIKSNKVTINESYEWKFDKVDEGRFFLLGPESTRSLFIQVDKFTSNGLKADPIVVFCNGVTYHLKAKQSITCYPNFNDVIFMGMEPQDFKNGSIGSYTFHNIENSKR
jgi:hypothetical protein